MNNVVLSEILDIAQYEKGARRVSLSRHRAEKKSPPAGRADGDFRLREPRHHIISDSGGSCGAERIVHDDAIRREIDTYNQLLPHENELAATMLIELPDGARIREEITKFHGVNTGEATYVRVGDERLPGVFDAEQSDDRRISAVQYLRFRFSDAQREAFVTGASPARLVIDHPNYRHEALVSGAVREELTKDFL